MVTVAHAGFRASLSFKFKRDTLRFKLLVLPSLSQARAATASEAAMPAA